MTTLQFSPFASTVLPEFWTALTKLKIDELKLSEHPVPVRGTYTAGKSVLDRETGKALSLGTTITFDVDSFERAGTETPVASTSALPAAHPACSVTGTLLNFNTVEAFKASDKQALFKQASNALWTTLTQSDNPTAADLNSVFAIAFAELKKYAFYHWFSFPAFIAKPAWTLEAPWTALTNAYSEEEVAAIQEAFRNHVKSTQKNEASACILRRSGQKFQTSTVSQATVHFAESPDDERILLFVDPSSDVNAAGWPLRNLLAFLHIRHEVKRLRVICYRASVGESLTSIISNEGSALAYDVQSPVATGWEKNSSGKLAPRLADLGALMDPKRLAEQAVDLNLKLMRWRILPSLDLEKIQNTKCLLLGAGTLGCYVARSLMAWGVRKITLADSGKVSYSNPVRQPLFGFTDCLEGGKPKAACAAEALKRIFPSIDATGIQLAIPMPGHPVPESSLEATKAAVEQLEALIDAHDVVYLLMDSRESRWLPTLLGAAKGKLVMNAALGFDSYLVMRHGVLEQPVEQRLGCYYCNDIVAPMDSLSDRTLDQMCTVTRPGLAAIASASAVELMTSILQHPKGMHAPSEITKTPGSVLGAVPHQLRGSLGDFSQMKITGNAYKNCTACSDKIVDRYRSEGMGMLLKAFEDAKYLEEITGLDKLQAETDAVLEAVDWDEEDDSM